MKYDEKKKFSRLKKASAKLTEIIKLYSKEC